MSKTLLLSLLGGGVAALLVGNPAQALTFNWSYSGVGVNASGTLDTIATGNPSEYMIQAITGQRNSVAITALLPLNSYGSDNRVFYPNPGPFGNQLNLGGFSFLAGGNAYNVYFSPGNALAAGGGTLPIGQWETQFDLNSQAGIKDTSISFSATPVPTPALLPGLIGMGLAASRKRKAEAAQEAEEA